MNTEDENDHDNNDNDSLKLSHDDGEAIIDEGEEEEDTMKTNENDITNPPHTFQTEVVSMDFINKENVELNYRNNMKLIDYEDNDELIYIDNQNMVNTANMSQNHDIVNFVNDTDNSVSINQIQQSNTVDIDICKDIPVYGKISHHDLNDVDLGLNSNNSKR